MPSCDLVPAALQGPAPWDDTLALETKLLNGCPDTFLWLQSDATSVFNWTRAIPREALGEFLDTMPGLHLISWNDRVALPSGLWDLIAPEGNPWPMFLISLVAGLVLAALSHVRVRATVLAVVGLSVSALCVVGYSYAVWASDGVDLGRHLFPFIPLVSVAVLLLPSTIPSLKSAESSSPGDS